MNRTLMFTIVTVMFGLSPALIAQTTGPGRDTRPAPGRVEPRKTPSVAQPGPKELPDAKLAITNMAYVDTLPGARITIKNIGGKTTNAGVRVVVTLIANKKLQGAWQDINESYWRTSYVEVWCPKGKDPGLYGFGGPFVSGRTTLPALKGGESITLNVKLDQIGLGGKVNITSLVSFAAEYSCRPRGFETAQTPLSDYKYMLRASVSNSTTIDIYKAVYLNP